MSWHGPGKRRAETEIKVRSYHRRRAELIRKLGGKCVDCGRTDDLQFDHIQPRAWSVRDKSRWSRIVIYEREAAEGKLELRCKLDNQKKGKP